MARHSVILAWDDHNLGIARNTFWGVRRAQEIFLHPDWISDMARFIEGRFLDVAPLYWLIVANRRKFRSQTSDNMDR